MVILLVFHQLHNQIIDFLSNSVRENKIEWIISISYLRIIHSITDYLEKGNKKVLTLDWTYRNRINYSFSCFFMGFLFFFILMNIRFEKRRLWFLSRYIQNHEIEFVRQYNNIRFIMLKTKLWYHYSKYELKLIP